MNAVLAETWGDPAEAQESRRRTGTSRLGLVALVSGLLTILCTLLMPFAPVEVSTPVVSWPQDPSAARSTMLPLTSYRPLGMDVRFGCRAITTAARADGVVLATADPAHADAVTGALLVTARAGQLTVELGGTPVYRQAVPPGPCEYRIVGDASSTRVLLGTRAVATLAGDHLPVVDALVTSAGVMPGATSADLSVQLRVDDQSATVPGPVKIALMVLLGLSAICAVVCLVLLDRRIARPGRAPARRRFLPRPVDGVVALAMLAWLFLGPQTGDDGYYSVMAQNVSHAGQLGNYYTVANYGYTPFTWFYDAISGWQHLFGLSPTVQRTSALLFGLVTWWAIRRFTAGDRVLPASVTEHRFGPPAVRGLLAAVYLTWWLVLDMGIRPEGLVTLCGSLTLLAVATAIERQRLVWLGVAVGIAALGITAHPTGFTALAPILVALPAIWRLLRQGEAPWRTVVARAACALAPGALAGYSAFATGSLETFLHATKSLQTYFPQNAWYDEIQRYTLLLAPGAMGSFPKRAAVLTCLLLVGWFVLLQLAARLRGRRLPERFTLVGWSVGLAFPLLWITPSKWTHHFGSFAGAGSVLIVLVLVGFIPLTREIIGDLRRLPVIVIVGCLAGVVVTAALAGHGQNAWPFTWNQGLPHADLPPALGPAHADSLAEWVGLVVVAAFAVYLVLRRRGAVEPKRVALLAAPVVCACLFVGCLGYVFGTFTVATARTWNTYSPQADAIRDPLATGCALAGAIDVLDERDAAALPTLPRQPAPPQSPAFRAGTGWLPASPPSGGAAAQVWGSLVTAPGQTDPNLTTGSTTTPWYGLSGTTTVGTLVSGRLAGGNSLVVEYGRATASGVQVLGRRSVNDGVDDTMWRDLVAYRPGEAPAGTTALRLVATDATVDTGGWLAFSAPTAQRVVPLSRYLPSGTPTAVAWQAAYYLPCQRLPSIGGGITEPARYGLGWGGTATTGLSDNAWLAGDLGAFGHVPRSESVTSVTAWLRDDPALVQLQLYRFDVPYAADAYSVDRRYTTAMGWAGPR